MSKIVKVESSGNPFAIGVVGGRLRRQPANLQEAAETARSLEKDGFNYSIGLTQINRIHFKRLGWEGSIEKGFDICRNLEAGAGVLEKCKQGAARALKNEDEAAILRAALSCYYSGNYVGGEKSGYVDKVLAQSAVKQDPRSPATFQSMFD